MIQQFIPNGVYKSTTDGWVEFIGVAFHGNRTVLQFRAMSFAAEFLYWPPETIDEHFAHSGGD